MDQSLKDIANALAVDECGTLTDGEDTWDPNSNPRRLAPSRAAAKAPETKHSFSYRTPWYQYPPLDTVRASTDCPPVRDIGADKKVELVAHRADEAAQTSARIAQVRILDENTLGTGRSKMGDRDFGRSYRGRWQRAPDSPPKFQGSFIPGYLARHGCYRTRITRFACTIIVLSARRVRRTT